MTYFPISHILLPVMTPSSIITLTTDFGTADSYVGTIKGVILSINPQSTLVDITHQIPPQDIMEGCLALSAAYSYFPKGTIHVAVVDPGVGSFRRPILVETERYFFIGPDNGILSFIFTGPEVKNIFEISNPTFFLPSPAATFHARDIFSPAAAHLSTGTSPQRFGSPLTDCISFNFPELTETGPNQAEGEIIHIDRFGNLITNLSLHFVKKVTGAGPLRAEVKGKTVLRLLGTYAQAEEDELFCLFGSSGFLELSVKNRSAQEMINARKGDKIKIKKADP